MLGHAAGPRGDCNFIINEASSFILNIYVYKLKRKKKTNPVNRRKKKKVEIQKMIVCPTQGHAEEAWLAF